ncbi:uncharacterized mitochondrial protein AtMg00810-like isoform X3 [Euphorbia lathyris]|uniref:uncharacterized mitochondrial protein AtMg00810-like isoform X3 n=1 Tax=Euphorbia lathyris TaxID=212925 RepID=UPI003313714B
MERTRSSKLNIAIIHPDLGIGGAERLIVDAAVELASHGHSVHIFTSHHDKNRCFEETISGTDSSGISSLKSFLHGQFHTKDLGALKYFLGIEVSRSKKGIFLSQRKYVLDLLSETGKSGAKPCSAPMTPNAHLTSEGEPFEDLGRYRRLVGKLNYLTVTRPDIAYSVSVVSQFMSSPTVDHWTALVQILCYLKGTPGRGLLYKNYGHTQIECFSDADWAGDKDDRRSTTGYCVFVGGNLISWKSKKQHVVSRSSAESEYRAMSQSVCEIMWIRHLLFELGFDVTTPAKLWCDNQAALHIASNPVFHERTKHIEIDCHFVREKLEENIIATAYIGTNEQLGDIFTRATMTKRSRVRVPATSLICGINKTHGGMGLCCARCKPNGHLRMGVCRRLI